MKVKHSGPPIKGVRDIRGYLLQKVRVGQTETHNRGQTSAGGELGTGTRLSRTRVGIGINQEIPLGTDQVDQEEEDMDLGLERSGLVS